MKRQLLIALSTTVFFAGCLTKELPSYSVYSLKLNNIPTVSIKNTEQSIFIAQPKALQSLKSKKIIYNKNLEQNQYALSLWSDEPSKMLQQLMTNYLDSTQHYKYVTTSKLNEISNHTLYSELLAFNHNINNSNTSFSIRVYLKNNSDNTIVSKTFSYEQNVSSNNAQNAVKSLNESVNQFMIDLDGFVKEKIK